MDSLTVVLVCKFDDKQQTIAKARVLSRKLDAMPLPDSQTRFLMTGLTGLRWISSSTSSSSSSFSSYKLPLLQPQVQ